MFIKTSIIAAAAIGVVTIATPSMAADASAKSKEVKAQIIQRNGETLYCVKETITGSRMAQRTCMTQAEWTLAGAQIKLPRDRKLAASRNFAAQN